MFRAIKFYFNMCYFTDVHIFFFTQGTPRTLHEGKNITSTLLGTIIIWLKYDIKMFMSEH